MVTTFYDAYSILNKIYGDKTFVKQAISSTVIEEKNRRATIKIVYGVLDKDIELSYYVSQLCDKNPKSVVRIILKIAMYNIKYLNKAPYAVTDSAVTLIKKLGKGGMGGFVNAILRKFINTTIDLPKEKFKKLSVKYSYPEFAVKMLVKDYGEEKAIKIMQADEERTCVRFNDGIDGEEYLKNRDFSYQITPFKNAFFVPGLKMDEDFRKGIYTFQSIGSIAICDAIKEDGILLDACSAPGGKAVNLASRFKSVTCFEVHPHRVELINDYAKRMNKSNVTAECRDSSVYEKTYDSLFDVVLCDCPCSGMGVIKDNPDIKLNRKEEDVYSLNKIQYQILTATSKYVKKGGALYYSTCSVLQEENSRIIEKFLKENDGFKEEEVESLLDNVKSEHGVTFTPDTSLGAGFYVCKLRRIN